MDTGIIGLIIWMLFFALHFFATQRLYCSKHFYKILVLILLFSLASFIFLDRKYPELKFQFSAFLIFHYGILLLLIRLGYRQLNLLFVKKKWMAPGFANKDFTYVTHSTGWGNDIWDEKYASTPSWLDYIFSYSLLFGPILLPMFTIRIVRGG